MSRPLLHLVDIWDLAQRFVPMVAADRRLSESGPRSWWPAHEIGHFLIATATECRQPKFGIDTYDEFVDSDRRYVIAREIAATSISQRLLRRSGNADLADEEIQYTDEDTLECSFERWCKQAVERLLRASKVTRLPTTRSGLEALLARKASEVGIPPIPRSNIVMAKAKTKTKTQAWAVERSINS